MDTIAPALFTTMLSSILMMFHSVVVGNSTRRITKQSVRSDTTRGRMETMMTSSLPDVMVDIETLDTSPTAAILSIGAARFDPRGDELGETFYTNVSLPSSLDAGFTVSGDTIYWWLKQEKAAQEALLVAPVKVKEALNNFRTFVLLTGEFKTTSLWSHGSDFDLVILSQAMQRCNLEVPWMRRLVRDTRTLFALAPGYYALVKAKALPKSGTVHNALDDALSQVQWVQTAYRLLKGAASAEA
jgi:hypothetical protein